MTPEHSAVQSELNQTLQEEAKRRLDELFEENKGFLKNRDALVSDDSEQAVQKLNSLLDFIALHEAVVSAAQKFNHHIPTNREVNESMLRTLQKSEAGDAEAQLTFGALLLLGKNMPRDTERGISFLEKAADNGSVRAAYLLGNMCEIGLLVPIDNQRAIKYYQLIADKDRRIGDEAKDRLGEIFEYGIGAKVDYAKAMEWYKKAAAPVDRFYSGYADAKYNIGRLYAQGKGTQRDYWEAAEWFMYAAGYGVGDNRIGTPQCALAIMYQGGLGVIHDENQADFWLNKPGALNSLVCRELKDFRVNTLQRSASVMVNLGEVERPHYHSPYPFTADELSEKLMKVAEQPEGFVTKQQLEDIFSLKFPINDEPHKNAGGGEDKTVYYGVKAGKSWYFDIGGSQLNEEESAFSFQWGDFSRNNTSAFDSPPEGMCINVDKIKSALERRGWALQRESRYRNLLDGAEYKKGEHGRSRLNFDRNSKCLLYIDILFQLT